MYLRKYFVICLTIFFVVSMTFLVAAQEDDIIRMTFSWPTQIDPAVGSDYSSSTAITNLYDALVYPDPTGKVIPHLAENWEISYDGLDYTFMLRKDVKFHNGNKFTAEDVKYSFDRLMAIGEGYGYIFKGKVENVEILDDYTVKFNLDKPFGPFLSALVRLYIVDKETVTDHVKDTGEYGENGDYGKEWLNINDAGTGAYKVKDFSVGSYLLTEKFEDYFGEMAENAPKYFEMIGTTDSVTVRTLMKRQELEISDQWQTLETFNTLEKMEGIDLYRNPDGGQLYIMMNTKLPPTDDIHVRKAIAYAFDYKVVTEQIYPGTEQACGPVSRVLPGWTEVFQYNKDLEKAKEELKKSKYYAELDKYTIILGTNSDVADLEKISLMLMSDGKKIGLNMEIKKLPWMKIIDSVARVETTPHLLSIWVNPHFAEAGSVLETKYHSGNTGTWEQSEWLQNEEIDVLIDEAIATVNYAKRMELYAQAQEKIVDLCPSIFIYDNMERHAYQADYINWPQVNEPLPVMGYNFDMRFIEVFPEKKNN
jgi:peptide/nickel transport system substrate-binding protein